MIPADAKKPKDARRKSTYKKEVEYYSDKRIKMELYGNEIRILSENDKSIVYFVENKTGNGVVTYYDVFDGIEVYYNDFHMSDGFVKQNISHRDIIEINHCREGRFECAFKSGGWAYLCEGDLAINVLNNTKGEAYFPLSHYHGISIIIDVPKATKTFERLLDSFGIKVNIKNIKENASSSNGYFIIRTSETIEHVFSELYNVPNEMREGYIKVKIMELLMFLCNINMDNLYKERQYFSRKQVKKIREIRDFLVENLETRFTLVQLSKKFSISMTSMKNAFKEIYGTPIVTYMREYRIQVAAKTLRNSDLSISQISEDVGYQNPAKFTEAFQKIMKCSPSEYRKNIV
jgi:AraC-like DNA-binding protein